MEKKDDSLIEDIINKIEPTEEELNEFKSNVVEWFNIDNTIRKLNTALKERKVYQKKLNNTIQDFMFNYKYNDLNTQNGRLKANIKSIPKPINIKEIKTKIVEYDNLSGRELIEKIFNIEERPLIEKKIIKRIIPKVSMSIDL
jgi:hypothetical protein